MKVGVSNQRGWIIFSLFVLITTVAGTVCLLTNPYLWFDEALQFFLSLGRSHWSPPFSEPRGFSDILAQNNRHLFDPVGFTLLLRAWQEISLAVIWLRTLPLIGFLGMAATGYRILRCSAVPAAEALLLTSLFASSPLLYRYAAELRPYSYEAWGTLYALSVLYRYSPQRSGWWKFGAGLAMSFFLWMRYPVILVAGLSGTLIFCKVLLKKDNRLWPHYLLYLLPQMLSAALIYWFCIRLQPLSDQSPEYARAMTLRYSRAFLLQPWTLFYHGAVLMFFLIFPLRERFRYPIHLGRFSVFTGLLFIVWNTLSILGFIPSDPAARWAIGLNATAMMCLFMTLAALLSGMPVCYKPLAYLLLAALALSRPALMTWRWYQKNPVHFRGPHLVQELSHVANTVPERIWCGSFGAPEVKYLYEYGALHGHQQQARYPQHFVLLNPHNEFDSLRHLPQHQKVLWLSSADNFPPTGEFAKERWNNSELFFRVWRVR